MLKMINRFKGARQGSIMVAEMPRRVRHGRRLDEAIDAAPKPRLQDDLERLWRLRFCP